MKVFLFSKINWVTNVKARNTSVKDSSRYSIHFVHKRNNITRLMTRALLPWILYDSSGTRFFFFPPPNLAIFFFLLPFDFIELRTHRNNNNNNEKKKGINIERLFYLRCFVFQGFICWVRFIGNFQSFYTRLISQRRKGGGGINKQLS